MRSYYSISSEAEVSPPKKHIWRIVALALAVCGVSAALNTDTSKSKLYASDSTRWLHSMKPAVTLVPRKLSNEEMIANLPGVSRVDGNPLDVLKRQVDNIGKAFKRRVITPEVGDMDSESLVPQFIWDLLAKIPRDASTWLLIGAGLLAVTVAVYVARLIWRALSYRWQANHIQKVITLLDAAHAQDPFRHLNSVHGRPRELVFTERAVKWLNALCPEASPELQLAVRAHKLESWKSRHEQRRVGEFLKRAGLGYLIAPVNFILERRAPASSNANSKAFQNTVALTNIDGLLESQANEIGLEEDAFLSLFTKEWKLLSPEAQQLGYQGLGPVVDQLPEELRRKVQAEVRAIATKAVEVVAASPP